MRMVPWTHFSRPTYSARVLLLLNLTMHSLFRECEYVQAILGGSVDVLTLDGMVTMKVPAGTQPDEVCFALFECDCKLVGIVNMNDRTILSTIVTHISTPVSHLICTLYAVCVHNRCCCCVIRASAW